MLQRDYFMRMIEMLSVVLEKILFNIEKKNYEYAEKEIETGAKTIVGIDLKLINILSIEDVLQLLKTSDVYAGRCLICAELLREYAEVLELKEKKIECENYYLKSLSLYIEALLTKELPAPENYFAKINGIIKKLSRARFSEETMNTLFKFYELSGQYSKVEDVLFELIDKGDENIHDKAIAFYKRLQGKSDEDLIKGNLSREEVEESLEEILNLKNNNKILKIN